MKALLDSTILIDLLKGDAPAVSKIEELKAGCTFYTTAVNIYEIMRGINMLKKGKETHLQAMQILLSSIIILQFDLGSSEKAAAIYSELRGRGIEIDEADYLIAGICLSNGIDMLITRNDKHFLQVKGLKTVMTY